MRETSVSIYPTLIFLGLGFDDHFNWKSHIADWPKNMMYLSNQYTVLKKVASTWWGTDRTTLMSLYRAIVLSIIDYGIPIHGTAWRATLQALDPILHLGITLSSGAIKSSSIQSLLIERGTLPLHIHGTHMIADSINIPLNFQHGSFSISLIISLALCCHHFQFLASYCSLYTI